MTSEPSRLAALRPAMQQAGADALWVSAPAHVHYLSGFRSGQDGKLLVTSDSATLYTDARYSVQAQEESDWPVYIARPPETYEQAAEMLRGLRVGIEAEHLSVAGLEDLRRAWDVTFVPLRGVVEGLRSVKAPAEVAAIRAAQQLADEAMAAVLPTLRPGQRESEVAQALDGYLRVRGAAPAFETIVASGPRGAMPHGVASERVMQAGELVTIDFGARLAGYHSDMTRTVPLGEVSDELARLYRAVLDAEETALAAVKPGVRAAELDTLAREVLARHGLAEYFAHSLGHGVGLAVHEAPGLRATSAEVLAAGQIITIEPGVYLPGVGGVRIEDLVLVTEGGHEVLSQTPKVRL